MADSLEKLPRASALQSLHRIVFLVFLLAFGATFILIASGFSSPLYYPLLIVLLLATLATTLLSLAQSLPAQNVLTVAILIAFLSSVVEMMNLKTHFPFGHRDWTNDLGPRLFHTLPLLRPLVARPRLYLCCNFCHQLRTLCRCKPSLALARRQSRAMVQFFRLWPRLSRRAGSHHPLAHQQKTRSKTAPRLYLPHCVVPLATAFGYLKLVKSPTSNPPSPPTSLAST
jgi:hypothetical protein